jgi:hypothetical protein
MGGETNFGDCSLACEVRDNSAALPGLRALSGSTPAQIDTLSSKTASKSLKTKGRCLPRSIHIRVAGRLENPAPPGEVAA